MYVTDNVSSSFQILFIFCLTFVKPINIFVNIANKSEINKIKSVD